MPSGYRPNSAAAPCIGHHRGIALVVVLWAIVLLSTMALASVSTQRTELQSLQNLISYAQARAYAQAAVHMVMFRLNLNSTDPDKLNPADPPVTWEYDGARIFVSIADERANIDLNAAAPELIGGLMASVGIAEDRIAQLRDAVIDWRDPNNLKQLDGAEDDDYLAQGFGYGAKDAPFDTVAELLMVMGVSTDDYRLLHPHLSVFSANGRVSMEYADSTVLQAIPGMTSDILSAYIADRQLNREQGQPTPLPVFTGRKYVVGGLSKIIRVLSKVRLANGSEFTFTTIADTQRARRGSPIVAWLDNAAGQGNEFETGGESAGSDP